MGHGGKSIMLATHVLIQSAGILRGNGSSVCLFEGDLSLRDNGGDLFLLCHICILEGAHSVPEL